MNYYFWACKRTLLVCKRHGKLALAMQVTTFLESPGVTAHRVSIVPLNLSVPKEVRCLLPCWYCVLLLLMLSLTLNETRVFRHSDIYKYSHCPLSSSPLHPYSDLNTCLGAQRYLRHLHLEVFPLTLLAFKSCRGWYYSIQSQKFLAWCINHFHTASSKPCTKYKHRISSLSHPSSHRDTIYSIT